MQFDSSFIFYLFLFIFFASQAIYNTGKWHCKWFAVQLQAWHWSRCCKLCMVCWVH